MSNRAERRARDKGAHKSEKTSFSRGAAKSRRGTMDEMSLQEKSRRLANGEDGQWKPTGHSESVLNETKLVKKPGGVKQWFRALSWTLIVLSALSFLVVMWVPDVPMWAILTICAVFSVSVLSLFFVGGSYKDNPQLDSYGTAV